jgi:hypothetical protein
MASDPAGTAELGRRARSFARDYFTSWEERTGIELEIIGRWLRP